MLHATLKTDTRNIASLLMRATLALVIFPHGVQKLFGLFGGYGFDGTMGYFTQTVGLPWILGFMVILAESLGTLFLLFGFLSRIVGASLIAIMTGAAATHFGNGFFMNWFGNQAGEGVEFFILAVAMALQVTIEGGGKWSVDGWLQNIWKRKSAGENFQTKFETYI
jgi:putative oxidoreductase